MKSCLIVDDSKVIRMVARKMLEDLNFEIEEAEDGKKALDACLRKMPDAILLLAQNSCMKPVSNPTRARAALLFARRCPIAIASPPGARGARPTASFLRTRNG